MYGHACSHVRPVCYELPAGALACTCETCAFTSPLQSFTPAHTHRQVAADVGFACLGPNFVEEHVGIGGALHVRLHNEGAAHTRGETDECDTDVCRGLVTGVRAAGGKVLCWRSSGCDRCTCVRLGRPWPMHAGGRAPGGRSQAQAQAQAALRQPHARGSVGDRPSRPERGSNVQGDE